MKQQPHPDTVAIHADIELEAASDVAPPLHVSTTFVADNPEGLVEDEGRARTLPARLALFRDATSLGGVESLVEWRRRQDPEAPPTLLRLSVGLEDAEDLIADLDHGLAAVAR